MNKNRFCALILSAFISATFITGCGASGAEAGASGTQETSAESVTTEEATADNATDDAAASDEDSSLVVAVCEEPEKGFDPCVKWPYSGDPIFQSMLYAYDSEGNVVEDLATGYTANEDQTEIEVTIRDDAQFSDGEQLTADDVVFSYTKIPETNTWVDYSTLDHVEKVDDYTVKFYLKKSNSQFKHIMAMTAIIPEHCYDATTYPENPIGSGPYVLKEWAKGEKMVVESNPYYYGDAPATNEITFLFVNTDTALSLLKTGEVDIARVSVNLADNEIEGYTKNVVDANDGMSIYMPSIAYGEAELDGVQVGNDVTSDVAIRKAIAYGINRQEIVDSILSGYGTPYYRVFEGNAYSNEENAYTDGDTEKAISILEEAGWTDTDGDGIREKDGVVAEFTLYSVPTDQTYSPRQGVCMAVQQYLAAIGIKMNIEYKQFSEIKEEKLLWQNAYLQGNGSNNPLEVYGFFHSDNIFNGTNNPAMYTNETVDNYIDEAFATDDADKFNELIQKAEWDGTTGFDIVGDCVWIPVIKIQHVYYVRDGVDMHADEIRKAPHRGATWTCTETMSLWEKK